MDTNGKKIKSITEDREFLIKVIPVLNSEIPKDTLRLNEHGVLSCSEPMYSTLVEKQKEMKQKL